MSVITFWNNGKEQTGKTLSITAITTQMSIEHNYKILVISTGHKDTTLDRCFWEEKRKKKNRGLFGPNTDTAMEDGIVGIETIMRSGKLQPENITNYTKIVFKDRLEILPSFKGEKLEYEEIKQNYPEIINLANRYYDLVFVDLDAELGEAITEQILQNSNLVIANLSQRLVSINKFMELREEQPMFNSKKILLLINRYDKFSKYTIKNITRYMGEKNKVLTIPYNTLFFEACEEAKVPDLFLRLRRSIDEEDRNYIFIQEVKRASDAIIYRLQDLAMKM